MNLDLTEFTRVSDKDGGEYAGPCPFCGAGEDRFVVFPHPGPYKGKNRKPMWFCRGNCPNCPGQPARGGGMWGLFEDDKEQIVSKSFRKMPKKTQKDIPSLHLVKQYSDLFDAETLSYLQNRGISAKTAQRFQIGKRQGKMITIPNVATIQGTRRSYGIKWRWLPQYQPEDRPRYQIMPGSVAKSIFNFDVLKRHYSAIIIVESLMDVLMLESLGLPAVAPFGGGAIWGKDWGQHFDCDVIVNVADRDEAKTKKDGTQWHPGEDYARRRAHLLGLQIDAKYQKVVTILPPESYTDLGEASSAGYDVKGWLVDLVRQTLDATSQ